MKRVLFLIFILIFPMSVFAYESCEISEDYVNYVNQNLNSKNKPRVCKTIEKEEKNYLNKATLESPYYNSVDDGYVGAVRDQMDTGTCWAFAANAVVEINAKKESNIDIDLSERHVEYRLTYNAYTNGDINENGIYRPLDDGGYEGLAASYYFMKYGPILEESMPFLNNSDKIAKLSMPTDKAVLDVGTFRYDTFSSGGCTSYQKESMKEKILKYGSVGINIYSDRSYYNGEEYFNNYGSSQTNHAVVVVGWDDTVSASKFTNATNDGAWIVRNSWGSNFGNKGYFYISYDDYTACMDQYVFSDIKTNTYDNVDTSSYYVSNYYLINSNSTAYNAFTFENNKTKYIDKISLEIFEGTKVDAYISTGDYKDMNTWKYLATASTDYDGVISLNFEEVEVNGNYTIIVKYSDSDGVYMPVVTKSSYFNLDSMGSNYYDKVTFNDVYYYENDNWYLFQDLNFYESGYLFTNATPVLYVYSYEKATDFTINLNNTVLYEIGDASIKYSFSSEKNVNPSLTIYNSNNNDVTNNFVISNNIIKVKKYMTPGTYYLIFKYGSITKKVNFVVNKVSKNNNYVLDNSKMVINMGNSKSLSISNFKNNLNTNLVIKNKNKTKEETGNIKTNSYIYANGYYYIIVVFGDVNGDGIISALDYVEIKNHIMGTKITNQTKILAADANLDSKISALDYVKIKNIIMSS